MDELPGDIQCLSVRQPFAEALVLGVKPVENRGWSPAWLKAGKPRWVLIHASSAWYEFKPLDEHALASRWPGMPWRGDAVTSSVIGAVRFDRVVGPDSRDCPSPRWWAAGPRCWVVGASIAFEDTVPMSGKLGLWTPPSDARDELEAAWAFAVDTSGPV